MWTLRHIALFGMLAMAAVPALAQQADAVIDRREILIGEQAVIKLSVPISKANPPVVVFPTVGDTLVKLVEVVKRSEIDTLVTGDGVSETRLEQRLWITSFDSGYYAIPPFLFEIDGDTVLTEAFLFTVKTVEVDTTKSIVDIRDIYEVQVDWSDYLNAYWPYLAGGLAAAALIVALLLLWQRYRKRQALKPVSQAPTRKSMPHEIALNALDRARREKVYLSNREKQYHTEISDALRDYLQAVFDMPAHELTTRQITDRLRYVDLPQGALQQLRVLLNMADMVKFAKEKPEADANDKAGADAMAWVKSLHHHLTLAAPPPAETTEEKTP